MALYLGSNKVSVLSGTTGGGSGGGTIDGVYYVTFMSEDGATELYKKAVLSGDNCMNPISMGWLEKQEKAPTNTEVYTQNGWSLTSGGGVSSSALAKVTEDRTVYAAFKAETRYYTVRFLDTDGVTELRPAEKVEYGGTAAADYIPEKEGHAFSGWVPSNKNITGDRTCVAQWISVLASGTCGDNAKYSLSVDYVLTISGSGPIADYSAARYTPWKDYRDKITSIVIHDGITQIGLHAFGNCSVMTSITIPNSVTHIKQNSIRECAMLPSVTIPSSVTRIDGWAFYHCTKLNSAVFEATNGWQYFADESSANTGTGGTAIPSSDLEPGLKAAVSLKSTYYDKYWRRTTS